MSERKTYKGHYLDDLRERVIDAYLRNRKARGDDNIIIKFPNNVRSDYYKSFGEDIFEITKVLISKATIYKLLYNKHQNDVGEYIDRPDQPFDAAIIEAFEKYANSILTAHGLALENIIGNELKGAQVINSAFIKKMESDEFVPTKTDFYLAKKDNDCQWRGVIRNWDYVREEHVKVKEQLINSFRWESRVAAVIIGAGGCGKSTFLRRLAIDCIQENFSVLWVTDLKCFYKDDLDIIGNTSTKYLAFVEDWSLIEKDTSLTVKFLNRISLINNIRLAIGDRYGVVEKEYRIHVLGKNYFELFANENEKIVHERVLVLNKIWKRAADKIFLSKDLYNAPIYLILFVLARHSEGLEFSETKDILSRFQDVVAHDQKRIYNVYPGLAGALYYWSCIYKEFRINISWEAFLEIADYYNGNSLVSQHLSEIEKSSFRQILNHYISFKKISDFSDRYNLADKYSFSFHHDILVEEGLSESADKNWHQFDNIIKLEILNILLRRIGGITSDEILENVFTKEDCKNEEQLQFALIDTGFTYIVASNIKGRQDLLEEMYRNASLGKDFFYWICALNSIAFFLDEETIADVIKKLINAGCMEHFVFQIDEVFSDKRSKHNPTIAMHLIREAYLILIDGCWGSEEALKRITRWRER